MALVELLLLALALITWLRRRAGGRRTLALAGVAGIAAVAVAAVWIAAAPTAGGATFTSASKPAGLIPWVSFDRGRAESLAASGQLVFVDVTADWCLTCKVNERLILDTPEVARAFRENSVVPMRADWTNHNDEIARFLAEHGRYGIPLYLLYLPGGDTHLFSELPSKADLVETVRRDDTRQVPEAN